MVILKSSCSGYMIECGKWEGWDFIRINAGLLLNNGSLCKAHLFRLHENIINNLIYLILV